MCFYSICTLSLLCGLKALSDGYTHYNVAIETDTFISWISVPLKILIWCSKWGLNLIYWWWDEVSKRLSALTEKDYICREKLVIGYEDQLNRRWHIMHFLHLNRLCQTLAGALLASWRMLFQTYIQRFLYSSGNTFHP